MTEKQLQYIIDNFPEFNQFWSIDDTPFIRREDAVEYCKEFGVSEDEIKEWFLEWSGSDPNPKYRTL